MNQQVFSIFLTQIAGQSRYEDEGDGTAVDTWFRDFNELIRGAERDATAEVREQHAKIAETSADIPADIRAAKFEPE